MPSTTMQPQIRSIINLVIALELDYRYAFGDRSPFLLLELHSNHSGVITRLIAPEAKYIGEESTKALLIPPSIFRCITEEIELEAGLDSGQPLIQSEEINRIGGLRGDIRNGMERLQGSQEEHQSLLGVLSRCTEV